MKKLAVATIACGLVFSAMTMAGQQKTNGKAMQDAKQAKQYGGAKFDGAKVNKQPAVKAGPVTRQDPKAISARENKAEQKRQAETSRKYQLDKSKVP
ncbi:MAG: hypothetical protein ABSD88_06645 [Candidatus Korobacteraceae bacterium]|jgi:uncharacterized protein YdeI (BOF family)